MPTAQDILETLVRLEGAGQYVSGMERLDAAHRKTAESQLRLIAQQRQFATAGAAIAGVSATAAVFVLRQADAFDRYRNKLEIATKSTEKAARIFEAAKQYANVTPFSTGGAVDAAARLEMYGMTAAKWLPLAGDMAGAMGRDITQAVEAIADAVSGGGLERLKEFGVGSMQLTKAGWTGSYQDQQGIESMKKALADLIGERYMGGAARMSTTLSGKLSTLQGEFETLAADIGNDLKPQVMSMVSNGIRLINLLKDIGPAGRKMAADLLTIGAVGGTVAVIVGKYKMWQTQQALMRMIAQQTAIANQEEAAAVNTAAAAYDKKAASQRGANASGQAQTATAQASAAVNRSHPMLWDSMDDYVNGPVRTGTRTGAGAGGSGWTRSGFFGRPQNGLFGGRYGRPLQGTAGMIQQTAGFTMAATSLSRVDWGGEWKAGSDNIAQLAKAAGYAAGAFNPLIFAATGAADALGNIIDAAAQKRLDRAAEAANVGVGFGPGGNPLRTSEELQKQYERERELLPGRYESPDDFIKRIRKAQAEAEARANRTKQQRKERADVEAALALAKPRQDVLSTRSGVAESAYKDLLDQSKAADDLIRNYSRLQGLLGNVTRAMDAEAKQHERTAGLLAQKAGQTKDAAEKADLLAQAEQELAAAGQLQAESTRMQRDLTNELADAQKEQAEKASEAMRKASADRMKNAEARAALIETVFGEESDQARQAQEELARLYAAEAQQAMALGDVADAHTLARQAVEAHRNAQRDLTGEIEKALDVGSAYADYLDAIGQTEQADAFRRQSLSRKQADLAQQYFAEGDAASGYRAAAAAERLARAGMKPEKGKRGGFIGGIGGDMDVFGGKAVTGALYAPAMQAANRQPIIVQPQTNINLQDGFIDKSKIRVHVNKGNAYEALAQ
jgi:hypothetical protein